MTPSSKDLSSSSVPGFWPRRSMPRVPVRSISYRRQRRAADGVKRNKFALPPISGFFALVIFAALAAASITLAFS